MRSHLTRRLMGFGLLVSVLVASAAALSWTATAHEHRTVGSYEFVVGFLNEPAVSNELNGLSLRITEAPAADAAATPEAEAEGVPVEGLEATLQAEVIYGDQRMPLTLEPAWNDPGHYVSPLIPTQPGDYSFHVWGTINGTEIDETFTAGPETFSTVIDRTTLEFPAGS
jgi:hypothetical protein